MLFLMSSSQKNERKINLKPWAERTWLRKAVCDLKFIRREKRFCTCHGSQTHQHHQDLQDQLGPPRHTAPPVPWRCGVERLQRGARLGPHVPSRELPPSSHDETLNTSELMEKETIRCSLVCSVSRWTRSCSFSRGGGRTHSAPFSVSFL